MLHDIVNVALIVADPLVHPSHSTTSGAILHIACVESTWNLKYHVAVLSSLSSIFTRHTISHSQSACGVTSIPVHTISILPVLSHHHVIITKSSIPHAHSFAHNTLIISIPVVDDI